MNLFSTASSTSILIHLPHRAWTHVLDLELVGPGTHVGTVHLRPHVVELVQLGASADLYHTILMIHREGFHLSHCPG